MLPPLVPPAGARGGSVRGGGAADSRGAHRRGGPVRLLPAFLSAFPRIPPTPSRRLHESFNLGRNVMLFSGRRCEAAVPGLAAAVAAASSLARDGAHLALARHRLRSRVAPQESDMPRSARFVPCCLKIASSQPAAPRLFTALSCVISCPSRLFSPLTGDAVVLSPACASFDEFRGFEHRGEVFRELVREMMR